MLIKSLKLHSKTRHSLYISEFVREYLVKYQLQGTSYFQMIENNRQSLVRIRNGHPGFFVVVWGFCCNSSYCHQ